MRTCYIRVQKVFCQGAFKSKGSFLIGAGSLPRSQATTAAAEVVSRDVLKCDWVWKFQEQGDRDDRIWIGIMRQGFFGGQEKMASLVIPFAWIPTDLIVKKWFPMKVKGKDWDDTIYCHVKIHRDTIQAEKFHAPRGDLLVQPAWVIPSDLGHRVRAASKRRTEGQEDIPPVTRQPTPQRDRVVMDRQQYDQLVHQRQKENQRQAEAQRRKEAEKERLRNMNPVERMMEDSRRMAQQQMEQNQRVMEQNMKYMMDMAFGAQRAAPAPAPQMAPRYPAGYAAPPRQAAPGYRYAQPVAPAGPYMQPVAPAGPYMRAPPATNPYMHAPRTAAPYMHAPPTVNPYVQAPPTVNPYMQAPPTVNPYMQAPPTVNPYAQRVPVKRKEKKEHKKKESHKAKDKKKHGKKQQDRCEKPEEEPKAAEEMPMYPSIPSWPDYEAASVVPESVVPESVVPIDPYAMPAYPVDSWGIPIAPYPPGDAAKAEPGPDPISVVGAPVSTLAGEPVPVPVPEPAAAPAPEPVPIQTSDSDSESQGNYCPPTRVAVPML